eukprot:CAMPEP_0197040374 /NCGR_PEP_ID=MMETSP1384-20130603/17084_1 /TAXON_ID=29189 /ORGANISM="Ammonia sp." /LENGTH=470 /DNA_ID=CAMNT_0042471117 /DNA_START=94 /DNA_END=1506 /DNA_ORIENTATION=-
MAQEQTTTEATVPEEQPQPQAQAPAQEAEAAAQQQQDNQQEAIKFIKEKLQSGFDEQNAKRLFEYYTLDKTTQKLAPPDARKLLLDILAASEWPLVVPDESLDAVFQELCLNEEGSISWVEFKTFFIYLQDRPLEKLLEIITKLFTKQQLSISRLVSIKPVRAQQAQPGKPEEHNNENANDDDDEKEKQQQQKQQELQQQNYYDRNKWKQAVQNLIPKASQIYIYFMDGYQILALAIGAFDGALLEPAAAEVKLDDAMYLATVRGFDIVHDMFPPITRSGGMKSKVARRIADSYIIARKWDENHFKLVDKTADAVHKVSVKWTEFDERYKVNERVNATATSIVASVKAFDEKHQLTRRLSAGAKQMNEKFGITDKLTSVADKISSNEKVQTVSSKVSESFKAAVKTIDDIGVETQQLVQEKRQKQENEPQAQAQSQNQEQQQEGGADNQPQQQYGNDNANDNAPVQVASQ